MNKLKVGILASTRGTNLQALIDDIKIDDSKYEIACVISDVYDAGALEKARDAKLPSVFVDPTSKTREEYDTKLVSVLDRYEVELVCLIGFMRILSPVFVRSFENRIMNVHPSLIPAFCGAGYHGDKVHEDVLADGCKVSGMTIHLVDEGVDTGEIICQKTCEVSKRDTVSTLKAKVQQLEKEWYPKIVRQYANKRTFLE